MSTKLADIEQAIYDLYQRVQKEKPGTRLDPRDGDLGALWAMFDREVSK